MPLSNRATVVGLISDTHGLLRPEVHKALDGVDLILHAGDVGGYEILEELRLIAPVQAVYGNTDDPRDPMLSQELIVPVDGVEIHVSHGHELGSPTPARLFASYAQHVVVYGHTHKALIIEDDGRIAVNPGAAGPRRFDLKPSVARLTVANGKAEARIVPLD